eukprot:3551236-Alexandrium_andersonii.AAC.1
MAAQPRARQAASPTKAKPAPPCCRRRPGFRAARRENAAPPSQAQPPHAGRRLPTRRARRAARSGRSFRN